MHFSLVRICHDRLFRTRNVRMKGGCMKIENKLYTVLETAEMLRTGQARVREYVRDGKLQSRRHGRRILVLGISIATYLGIIGDENSKENTREESPRA
jgi:hypothetical protein